MKTTNLLLALASIALAGAVSAQAVSVGKSMDAWPAPSTATHAPMTLPGHSVVARGAHGMVSRLAMPGQACLQPTETGVVTEVRPMHAVNPHTGGHDAVVTLMTGGRLVACVRPMPVKVKAGDKLKGWR